MVTRRRMWTKARVMAGVMVGLMLGVAACGSHAEPLSSDEASWCFQTQTGARLVERGEVLDLDLAASMEAARQAMDQVKTAGGTREEQFSAFDDTLQTDPAFIEVCRSLYEEH